MFFFSTQKFIYEFYQLYLFIHVYSSLYSPLVFNIQLHGNNGITVFLQLENNCGTLWIHRSSALIWLKRKFCVRNVPYLSRIFAFVSFFQFAYSLTWEFRILIYRWRRREYRSWRFLTYKKLVQTRWTVHLRTCPLVIIFTVNRTSTHVFM